MTRKVLKVHPADNIIVALQDLPKGEAIKYEHVSVLLEEDIPQKHKYAIVDLPPGGVVRMYGVVVGKAMRHIRAGQRISTDNVQHAAGDYQTNQERLDWLSPNVDRWKDRSFMGYPRADGQVGTMNYWLVIPLVFCENRNVEVIREALLEELGYQSHRDFRVDTRSLVEQYRNGASADALLASNIVQTAAEHRKNRLFPNVDGIKFLTHQLGCGGTREDAQGLCNLLAGYITNPNVAGATVLSLGCQNAQYAILQEAIAARDPKFRKPLYFFEQQQSQSERQLIADAVKHTFVGLIAANEVAREPTPLHKITLGLECGGSDGFSGISANPALGYASDLLVALKGTAILAEFPELNGVEQELINRCVNPQLANKFAQLMHRYSERAKAVGSGFENNPSPGNIKDGLITDAMKSAGAAKKGGSSPVVGVLDYAEPAVAGGLNLLCTPGGDVESTTGLAGSGANVIVFTTGLGTPTGNAIAPTIKFSTNTDLATRMPDLIDIDAGTIITGAHSIEEKGEELLEYIIEVASGRATPHAVRLGQDDFIPWKRGVSL